MSRTAIVIVGPRGAGKTTYCKSVLDSQTVLINWDEIAMSLFGKTMFKYHEQSNLKQINDTFWHHVETFDRERCIIDLWHPDSEWRKDTIERLKSFGFTKIICWYFVTPLEKCTEWFSQKKDVARFMYNPEFYVKEFNSLHEYAFDIENEDFDEIVRINPAII